MSPKELLQRAKEFVRDRNAEFYNLGIPEVPFEIELAVQVRDGEFLCYSERITHRYDISIQRLVPLIIVKDNYKWYEIALYPTGPRFWRPLDKSYRRHHHYCSIVWIGHDGRIDYPGYAIKFPVELRNGYICTIYERLPDTTEVGWTNIRIGGRGFSKYDIDNNFGRRLLLSSLGAVTLDEIADERL